MKSVAKVTSIILATVMAAGALAACNFASKKNTPKRTEDVVSTTASDINVRTDSPEQVAQGIVAAILKRDYKTVLTLTGLDKEGSFVSEDDVEFALPRSSYSSVVEFTSDDFELRTTPLLNEKGTKKFSVTVAAKGEDTSTNSINMVVDVKLGDDNKWYADGSELCNSEFSFRVPSGNVDVLVNGKKYRPSISQTRRPAQTGCFTSTSCPSLE